MTSEKTSVSTTPSGDLATLIGTAVATATASGAVTPVPATTNGLSVYHLVAAATDNATVVKNAAGKLYGWMLYNGATVPYKVTFHNSASTPTQGSGTYFTVMVPAQGTANLGGGTNAFTDIGIAFSSGIGITTTRITTASSDLPDSGTTDATANELVINLFYK